MSQPTQAEVDERATGRLFGLADAVFAIAMTLLALDLRVPDLGGHPADHVLRHALFEQRGRYLAFLLSFWVIAGYWRRHNSEMRNVRAAGHPVLVGHTLPLLLVVCALPFAANLLGTYGGRDGIAIVVYAGLNLLAVAALLRIRREARRQGLAPKDGSAPDDLELWFDTVALVLALPVGYVFRPHGPLALVVLMVASGIVGSYVTRRRRASGGAA